MEGHSVSFADVTAAAARIKGLAIRTPVFTCSTIDKMANCNLFFKCEQFQKVGAFKFRGACNAVLCLDEDAASRGVCTHSSGNHAQALALAASMRGIPSWIVMPSNAPSVKRAAVVGYGGQIVECGNLPSDRETVAARVVTDTSATFIHPYNDPAIIAGQGTIALEFLEDHPDLDALVVAVGGGGMLSGICVAAKSICPSIRIFAAEPLGADDAARSLEAGHIIPQTNPLTIADGLRTSLGNLTFPIIKTYVESVITVSDEEIRQAMRLVWERMKFVVEPSAAVPLAAALSSQFQTLQSKPQKVGIVLCGGNIDLDSWRW